MNSKNTLARLLSSATLAAFLAAPSVHAATITWDSDGSTANGITDGGGTWNTSSANFWNGTGDVVATSGNVVQFGAGGVGGTVNVSSQTIDGLIFGATITTGYTLNGTAAAQTLTIGASGIVWNSGAGATNLGNGNLGFKLSSSQNWTLNAANNQAVAGSVNTNGFQLTFDGTSSKTVTLNGTIKGGGSIVKSGASTLALNGSSNDFTGGVTLNGGIIKLGASTTVSSGIITSGPLGTGVVTLTSGTIANTGTSTRTIANNLSINGNVGFSTSADGNMTYTGDIDLNGGTRTLTVAKINEFDGVISNGGLTKAGASLLILGGANTYTGATTISTGTLQIGAGGTVGSLSTSSAITNNGALVFNRTDSITQGTHFSTAGIGGSGSLTQAGSGTLILNAANTYTGTTTISGGFIQLNVAENAGTSGPLGKPGTLANSIVLNGGGLQFTANNTYDYTTSGRLQLADGTTGFIDTNGQNVTFANAIGVGASKTGGVTKTGIGTLTLIGNNSYTGTTTINSGTLAIASTGNINTTSEVSIGAGEFKYNSATALSKNITFTSTGGTLSGTGTITNALTVIAGNTLAPGNSIGTMTFSNGLTIAGAYAAQIGTSGSTPALGLSDRAAVTGNLVLTGGTLSLTDNADALTSGSTAGGHAGAGAYQLITYTGSRTDTFASVVNPMSGTLHERVDYSTGNSVDLNLYRLATVNTLGNANVGNFHVGKSQNTLVLSATNTAVNDGFSEKLDLSGSATGSATFSGNATGIAAGSSTGLTFGINDVAGGHSGTVALTLNSNGAGTSGYATSPLTGQNITVTGTGYNLAAAAATQTVNVGSYHVGVGKTATLTIGNTAAVDAIYTEHLQTNGFSETTAGFTASGAASGIAGGGNDSGSLIVGTGTSAGFGVQSGTTVLALQSNAVNGSGLGTNSIGNQTVTITGTGYRLATVNTLGDVNFGNFIAGNTQSRVLSATNTAVVDSYSEKLDVSGTATGAASFSGGASLIAAGGSTGLTVGLGAVTSGSHAGTVVLSATSNGFGTSGLGSTGLSGETINVSGVGYDRASLSSNGLNVVNTGGDYTAAAKITGNTLSGAQAGNFAATGTGSLVATSGSAAVASFDSSNKLNATYTTTANLTFDNKTAGDVAINGGSGDSKAVTLSVSVGANTSNGHSDVKSAQIGTGGSYAGYSLTSSIGHGTTAALLGGTAAGLANINMAFDVTSATGLAGVNNVSDFLTLTGVHSAGAENPNLTDLFVLQLSYDTSISGPAYIAYIEPGTGMTKFVNAVEGNSILTSGSNLGNVAFSDAYLTLGDYGYDSIHHTAWAVVDHNSEFTVVVAVPEPSTWAMMLGGLGMLAFGQRLRRRSSM